MKNKKMSRISRRIIVIITLLVLVLLLEIYISKYLLQTSTYTVNDEKVAEPFTVVQLTDLHGSVFGKDNEKLIQAVLDTSPDLILITGDLIDYKDSAVEEEVVQAERLIQSLVDIAPVYVSYGNHEVGYDDLYQTRIADRYATAGATVLEGTFADIIVNGNQIRIGGIFGYCQNEYYAYIDGRQDESEYVKEFSNTDNLKILMCHMPLCWLDGSSLCDWAVDYVFAGHVHGGQVQIPIVGGLWAPDQGWFPGKEYGIYTVTRSEYDDYLNNIEEIIDNHTMNLDDSEKQASATTAIEVLQADLERQKNTVYHDRTLILSRGLGNTELLPRINNRPEIVIVHFR